MPRPATPRPYRLGFLPGEERIAVMGPASALRSLLTIPEAEALGSLNDPETPITLPSTRENFLAVEALGTPVSVAELYKVVRSIRMEPPEGWVDAVAHRRKQSRALAGHNLPHQEEFVHHAYCTLGTFNASDQGTGKTRSAWEMAELWSARRVLILTPKTLRYQWKAEHESLWPSGKPLLCIVPEGSLEERRERLRAMRAWPDPPRHALVYNYECVADRAGPNGRTIKGLVDELLKWSPDLLICDESWKLKNRTAKLTKAVMKLSKGVRTLLLTGTPIGNDVGDLWSQLRIINERAAPESYAQFMAEHAIMEPIYTANRVIHKAVGCQNPARLMRQIAPRWYRATKATCLQLPPRRFLPRVVLPLPESTQELYNAVTLHGEAALGAPLSLAGQRQVDLRLQQIAGGFRPISADPEGSAWRLEPLPDCPKIAWLREWAADTLQGNPSTRAIVWCRFTTEAARITAALAEVLGQGRAVGVFGQMPDSDVERIKASFNSRDPSGVQVICATTAKFAFGHNVPAGDWHVFFSHTYSAVERTQAEDRSHRQGRTMEEGAVTYVELVAAGTIDLDALAVVEEKRALAGQLSVETVATK